MFINKTIKKTSQEFKGIRTHRRPEWDVHENMNIEANRNKF
jgi:hypothetical protein